MRASQQSGFPQDVEVKVKLEDGQALEEYQEAYQTAEDSGMPTTSCYVEAKNGAAFCLTLKKPIGDGVNVHGDFSMTCSIDGRLIERCAWGSTHPKMSLRSLLESRKGQIHKRKLLFQKMETTDDEGKVTFDMSQLQHLGSISIVLKAGNFNPTGLTDDIEVIAEAEVGVAHEEKVKKMGSCISGGPPKLYQRAPSQTYTFTAARPAMEHRFIFKYRTRPVLELMHIIEPENDDNSGQMRVGGRATNLGKRKEVSSVDTKVGILEGEMARLERELKRLKSSTNEKDSVSRQESKESEIVDLTLEDD